MSELVTQSAIAAAAFDRQSRNDAQTQAQSKEVAAMSQTASSSLPPKAAGTVAEMYPAAPLSLSSSMAPSEPEPAPSDGCLTFKFAFSKKSIGLATVSQQASVDADSDAAADAAAAAAAADAAAAAAAAATALQDQVRLVKILIIFHLYSCVFDQKSSKAADITSDEASANPDTCFMATLVVRALEPVHVDLSAPQSVAVDDDAAASSAAVAQKRSMAVSVEPSLPAGLFIRDNALVGEAVSALEPTVFRLRWQRAGSDEPAVDAYMELEVLANSSADSVCGDADDASPLPTLSLVLGQPVSVSLAGIEAGRGGGGMQSSSPVHVEPALPAGVVLDAATMSLVGVPTATMSPTVMSGRSPADVVLSVASSSVLTAAVTQSNVGSRIVEASSLLPSSVAAGVGSDERAEPRDLKQVLAFQLLCSISSACLLVCRSPLC